MPPITPAPHLRWTRLVLPGLILLWSISIYVYVLQAPVVPVRNGTDLQTVKRLFHPHLPLQEQDRIILLDGLTPEAWAAQGLAALPRFSSRYDMTLERDGQPVSLLLQAARIPLPLALRLWGSLAALQLVLLVSAGLIGLLGSTGVAERGVRLAFQGLALYLSVLPLTYSPPHSWVFEPLLLPLQIAGIGLMGGIIVFFLCHAQPQAGWHRRLIPVLSYGSGAAIALLALLLIPGERLARAIVMTERVIPGLAGVQGLLALLLSLRAYRRNRDTLVRAQLRWLLWGAIVGIVPWLLLWGLPTQLSGARLQLAPLSLSVLPMLAVPCSFVLATLRYRLLDVDRLLNRSLVYLLLSLCLGLAYILVTALASRALALGLGIEHSGLGPFFGAMALAALLNPLLRTSQRGVDRIFYRGLHQLMGQVELVQRQLRQVADWDELLALLQQRIPTLLGIERAQLFLWEAGLFVPPASSGSQGNASAALEPELRLRLPSGWPLDRPLLLQSWEPADGAWLEPLVAQGYELAFVLVSRGHPVGLYALGRRLSGEWYERSAIKLLEGLADRIAGAVHTARLLEQTAAQARLRHELLIARHIQESLLPDNQLCHGALEVAALNVPASDIGGDLYLLQPGDRQSLLAAVGDVSGKGMGAALLMAVTSTMLTTLAAEEDTPSRLLLRLDQLLRSYTVRSRQNVALCCVRLTPAPAAGTDAAPAYELVAANAGAIPPLLRYGDGRLEWLVAAGPPLGTALSGIDYQPASALLCPGDLLLLCSDGLLEARDSRGALLSFDGLEQALATAPPAASAEQILEHLMQCLDQHMGSAEASDDITLLLIRHTGV